MTRKDFERIVRNEALMYMLQNMQREQLNRDYYGTEEEQNDTLKENFKKFKNALETIDHVH